jgi:pimeloyl-ACP methyl ester carboxylesterase
LKAAEYSEPLENFFELGDGRIHYLDWGGSGDQIHFLHGNGFCAGTYAPFIQYLRDDYHMFASDIRGHGKSDQPNVKRIRHWKIFAEDLKLLIEHIMSPPIFGMGHSLGAMTTYIAASIYPELFKGIILLDPPMLPRRTLWTIAWMRLLGLNGNIPLAQKARRRRKVFNGRKDALKRFTAGRGIFKTWSQEFIEAYLECGLLEKDPETAILKCDPELEAQIFESIPVNVLAYGKKLSCPVLAIRGEHSDVFAAESAERLKRVIADYELETLPDSGHFVPMEKPQECAWIISDFIRRKIGNTIL